jgi:hypothetical protein
VNLCIVHLGMMHLTVSCEVHHFEIVQCILDSLRMVTNMCYLVALALVYLSFIASAA